MPGSRRRLRVLLLLGLAALLFIAAIPPIANAFRGSQSGLPHAYYLPLAVNEPGSPQSAGLLQVNYYRSRAGVPVVNESTALSRNCFEHARYMAENNDLTHQQNPQLPYASKGGQLCAERGNAWLGSDYQSGHWKPDDSVAGWMSSVPHRLWLLYPTTARFGFGFYETKTNRAGAALDVLSAANFGADAGYSDWPVIYPGKGESSVPATRYPITLNWSYTGPKPTLEWRSVETSQGRKIATKADTNLPAGHKGIQIFPQENLPENSVIIVKVRGTYNGAPFSYEWRFNTAGTQNPYP